MKKLINKILLPTLAMASVVAPIAVSSCSCTMTRTDPDGYSPFPEKWLLIEDGVLKEFNEDHKIQWQVEGYDKLTIPANVTSIAQTAFAVGDVDDDAGLAIKKIDFKAGCVCTDFGESPFVGCKNLEMIVLPPKYNKTQNAQFMGCEKLKTLDITNVEGEIDINPDNCLLFGYRCVEIGEIWAKNNATQIANAKKFKDTEAIVYDVPQPSALRYWNIIFK